jgi:hypothetical protein
MKTINLKQTSVAKPGKWFQWRRRLHDPREARPERSQFRDQSWRLHLREFAKNSRIFRHPHRRKPGSCNFFSLVDRLLRTPLAFDMQMPQLTKGIRSTP